MDKLLSSIFSELTGALVDSPATPPVTKGVISGVMGILSDPTILNQLEALAAPSGLEVARQALESCEHGKISPATAAKIVEATLMEFQQSKLRSARF
jgi:hypothetical protein